MFRVILYSSILSHWWVFLSREQITVQHCKHSHMIIYISHKKIHDDNFKWYSNNITRACQKYLFKIIGYSNWKHYFVKCHINVPNYLSLLQYVTVIHLTCPKSTYLAGVLQSVKCAYYIQSNEYYIGSNLAWSTIFHRQNNLSVYFRHNVLLLRTDLTHRHIIQVCISLERSLSISII